MLTSPNTRASGQRKRVSYHPLSLDLEVVDTVGICKTLTARILKSLRTVRPFSLLETERIDRKLRQQIAASTSNQNENRKRRPTKPE